VEGGYYSTDFVKANLNNPRVPGGVFWAGSSRHLSYDRFKNQYELIPFGIVNKVRGWMCGERGRECVSLICFTRSSSLVLWVWYILLCIVGNASPLHGSR
jgi:hypothetical protein